ncbi:oligomeric golgi complex component, COG2-domain-containing protein [Endogone sp. FLAS-F59071]|nr:oligomeric golgi complex component, COG2-domain-containing protein [Endogone sp. FLAS-F59071]|eukprot:RUS17090.1 oligomeric golgi complex component, COG2-domain-containing protein [Endogone sp. FLAS-F59071]
MNPPAATLDSADRSTAPASDPSSPGDPSHRLSLRRPPALSLVTSAAAIRNREWSDAMPAASPPLSLSTPFPQNAIERTAFTAPDFDADAFLSSRRHLGLDALKQELGTHLAQLKNELVELINRDYADFINLSTNLKGVDRVIEDLKKPLDAMREEVKIVRTHLQTSITDLESKLAHRASIREKKACLQLLLNIHDSVSKVEDLLQINGNGAGVEANGGTGNIMVEGGVKDESVGKRIERVAIEYNQMQYLVTRGRDLPFVANIDWTNLASALRAALQDLRVDSPDVRVTLDPATRDQLTQCLRTYAIIDQTRAAEGVIREEMVVQFLEKTITRTALDSPLPDSTSSTTSITPSNQLAILYSKILVFISSRAHPLLDITHRVLKGTGYEILANAVWAEIAERIVRFLPGIFAPGRADVFHKNYTVTMTFVRALESHCASQRSLLYLRAHPTYVDFVRRWQLPVYFQLRFKEITGGVEEACAIRGWPWEQRANERTEAAEDGDNEENGEMGPVLPATRAVMTAIVQCWSDDVYIYGLAHRFWKLTLQLLKRYKLWIEITLSDMTEPRTDSGPGPLPLSAGETADEVILLRQLVVVAFDVEGVAEKTKAKYYGVITPRLPESMQDEPLLEDSITHALTHLTSDHLPDLHRKLTAVLTKRCLEHLKHARLINQQYLHTNRPAPREHSAFVPLILHPFILFQQQNKRYLRERRIREYATAVAEAVTTRYAAVVTDMMVALKRTEESLRRLKQRRGGQGLGGQAGEGGMSDEDKIRLQVWLDVRRFGVELATLEIDKDRFEHFQDLYKVVEPYERNKKYDQLVLKTRGLSAL